MKRVTTEGMQGVVILVDLRGVADGKRRLYLCDSDVWSRQDIRSARYSAECDGAYGGSGSAFDRRAKHFCSTCKKIICLAIAWMFGKR